MANLIFDGFENLITSYLQYKMAQNVRLVVSSSARPGGSTQALAGGNNGYGPVSLPIGSNVAHVFYGVGFRYPGSTVPSTQCQAILYDSATAQVGWKLNSNGSISVYRGATSGSTLIGTTTTGLITLNSVSTADYKMVELEVVFATGATGTVKLRVNDTEVLNVSSVQTSNTANAYCTHYAISGSNAGSEGVNYDDLYVNDDTGSAPHNTYYGEAFVVERVLPNADGNSSQWTRSTGTNNYAMVDDTGNDDTDYVSSSTTNQIDTYGCSNLTNASGTVIGIEHNMIIRKDDVANRVVAPVIRTGGTDYPQTNRTATGTYTLWYERINTNPNTSLPFSISDINGIEIGVKLTT